MISKLQSTCVTVLRRNVQNQIKGQKFYPEFSNGKNDLFLALTFPQDIRMNSDTSSKDSNKRVWSDFLWLLYKLLTMSLVIWV